LGKLKLVVVKGSKKKTERVWESDWKNNFIIGLSKRSWEENSTVFGVFTQNSQRITTIFIIGRRCNR
jgi:hypothetical protein